MTQGAKAFFLCLISNLNGVTLFHNNARQPLSDFYHLVDTDPPFIATVTLVAALEVGGIDHRTFQLIFGKALLQHGFSRNIHALFAVVAEAPSQTLGDDQVHRRGKVERRYPHVQHTGQSLCGTVGVQGGHYHVTGLGSLDGDVGGFQVPNLTHHDHIRVLPQKCPQGFGEVQPLLGVHVNLIDTLKVDLDWVFGGGDVALHGVQQVKAGVQRYSFTGTGWASHQNHTLWLFQCPQVHLLLILFIAEGVDTHLGTGRIENPQYDLFTPKSWQGVDSKVDCFVFGDLEFDPAILRFAPLGDIHGRHNLQTGS